MFPENAKNEAKNSQFGRFLGSKFWDKIKILSNHNLFCWNFAAAAWRKIATPRRRRCWHQIYTVCQKSITDIFNCDLKTNCQI